MNIWSANAGFSAVTSQKLLVPNKPNRHELSNYHSSCNELNSKGSAGALCDLCQALSGLTAALYDTDAMPLDTKDGRSNSMAGTPL